MKIVTIAIKITVDEDNIRDKYPNFRFNWETTDEFIEHLIDHIESDEEIDNLPADSLDIYGYKIDVLTREQAKVEDLNLDKNI